MNVKPDAYEEISKIYFLADIDFAEIPFDVFRARISKELLSIKILI